MFELGADLVVLQVELHSPNVHVIFKEIHQDFVLEFARGQETCIVLLDSLSGKSRSLASQPRSHLLEVFLEFFLLHAPIFNDRFLLDFLHFFLLQVFPLFEVLVRLFNARFSFGLAQLSQLFEVLRVVLIKFNLRGVYPMHIVIFDD